MQADKKHKFLKELCPHCDTYVSKSTWYRHYSEFYDKSSDTWIRCERNKSANFVFDGNESNSDDVHNADPSLTSSTSDVTGFNFGETDMVCFCCVRGSSFFFEEKAALDVLCCLALFVCLALLLSFFLLHLSIEHAYTCRSWLFLLCLGNT